MSADVKSSLPADFTARPAVMADLETIVDLFNEYAEVAYGLRKLTLEDARRQLTTPGFDMEQSMRVILSPDERIVGCVVVMDLNSPPVHPNISGCVHPEFEGRGIGTYLLQWAEQRARQAIARVPQGLRVAIQLSTSSTHEPTRRLFQKRGYRAVRHSWLMTIDLEQAPPEAQFLPGLTLCTYQDRPDLRVLYRAVNEAFRDHWGYVEQPEERALERWRHRVEHDPAFDPTLWFLLLDEDEIAAMALCRPMGPADPEMGFVDTLGVRRPWRRRGLALTLLHHVFGQFYRRGKKRVGLGVDADSLTGATRLYEKAGMHVAQRIDAYALELRPGEELAVQSLEGA